MTDEERWDEFADRWLDLSGDSESVCETIREEFLAALANARREALTTGREQGLQMARDIRGVETPCKACNGFGSRCYGSTSTWRGGIGGQMMTNDVCDKCWGSGDAHRKGADLRALESRLAEARREAIEECANEAENFLIVVGAKWRSLPHNSSDGKARERMCVERIRALGKDGAS